MDRSALAKPRDLRRRLALRRECDGEPTFRPERRLSAGKRTLTRQSLNVGNVPQAEARSSRPYPHPNREQGMQQLLPHIALPFAAHHGYGCLPPHCRRSALTPDSTRSCI
jgi:hypothetical protein